MQYLECVHIQPKDGKRVLDPLSMKPLPQEGVKLDFTPHWRRRELEGDVIITSLKNKAINQKNTPK